jgi:DNA-binding transcriptional LysR family regulator
MELRHLRYFVATAEELHFGRAARRLAISQPPLSLTIRQLEDELGVRLLERDNKRVTLTPAGEVFLADARHVLSEAGKAQELARRVAAGKSGRLRVGFVGSMLYRGLPEYVSAFRAAAPSVVLTLTELNSAEQIDAVAQGRLDVGFVHAPQAPRDLRGISIAVEPFVACVPEDHRLARPGRMRLASLADEAFVLFARDASPAYYDSVIAVCGAAGFIPRVEFQVRHWLTVVALVARKMGVALVPEAIRTSGMKDVKFLPLLSNPVLSTSWLVWNPGRQSPARDAFLSQVTAARPLAGAAAASRTPGV